jgi:TRAP-type C4-dicarboxylate transport system substrate-binding protein
MTHTKKLAPHPEDIAGTKIRVQPGAIYAATYQTLKAPPTAIDVSEIYLSLSQGAVDAVEVPLISLIASKFYEIAKHVSNLNFVYNAGAIMASKKTMDKLPPEFQKAVQEASLAVSPGWRTMMAAKTQDAIAFLKGQGCEFTDVDTAAYAKALEPVWTQYKPIVGADLVNQIQQQTGRS